MDISINLLPRELRAKPFIDPKVLLLIIIIGALAGCCFYFYAMTNSARHETEQAKQNTAQYKKDAQTITNNPELVALKASIDALTKTIEAKNAANRHYDTFLATRVLWGDALARVCADVPVGVAITSLVQDGTTNTLIVKGTALNYGYLTTYALQLTEDEKLTLSSVPPLKSDRSFTLTVGVAPGGGQ